MMNYDDDIDDDEQVKLMMIMMMVMTMMKTQKTIIMMMMMLITVMTFLASLGSSPRLISLICESSSTSPSLPSLIYTPKMSILFMMNTVNFIFFSIFRKGVTFFKLL